MENVRIAILNSENKVVAYMDNTAPNAMHYYDDELHTYLQGSAYTFKFETGTLNTEAEYLAVGNHLAFQHADSSYYRKLVEQCIKTKRTDILVNIRGIITLDSVYS